MDPRFLRNDTNSLLGHTVEECGEVLAAIGKAQRWGLESVNPLLPDDAPRETNREWILRELNDLLSVAGRLYEALEIESDDPLKV